VNIVVNYTILIGTYRIARIIFYQEPRNMIKIQASR